MRPQAMVDLFAKLAEPRILELLKLKSAEHVYNPDAARGPGKLIQSMQPYKNIERFVSDDRVMSYIVDPGLVPIVKSIVLDVRGRRLLVTQKVAAQINEEAGVVAHLSGFGMRVVLRTNPETQESRLIWECLYRVE